VVTVIDRRKAWAARFIEAASDAEYGSPAWAELPEGPAKWGAAMRAAECWATDGDNLAANLAAALDGRAADLAKNAEDAVYVAQRDAWRSEWSPKSWRPHPANRGAA
jgi:hypothetical protein